MGGTGGSPRRDSPGEESPLNPLTCLLLGTSRRASEPTGFKHTHAYAPAARGISDPPFSFFLFCHPQLGFSTHRQKRMRQIKKAQQRGTHDPTTEDPFELFIGQTDIRWCYYKDSHKVLGQTFGMLVLQVP